MKIVHSTTLVVSQGAGALLHVRHVAGGRGTAGRWSRIAGGSRTAGATGRVGPRALEPKFQEEIDE